MTNQKDERADRERTSNDINDEIKKSLFDAVKRITREIKLKLPQRKAPLLVAIDGGSSAGKSSVAILVAAEINGVIVQGDDFCETGINWDHVSVADKASLCIDWKRARKEAIEPLLAGHTASWHPFNFQTGIGLADYFVTRKSAPVIIIDGIYSSNPGLLDIIDLSILIDVPTNIRYHRHNEREGHDDEAWHKIWDEFVGWAPLNKGGR